MIDQTDMDQSIQVTIVVISYRNTSFILQEAMSGVLNQTIAGAEILLIDRNAAADKYSLSLQEDSRAMKNVRVLACQGMTEGRSRNLALETARGKFIAFADGSDVWEPDKALKQVEALLNGEGERICFCSGTKVGPNGTRVFSILPKNTVDEILLTGGYSSASSLMYETELLREAGGFDEKLSIYCDSDMLVRLQAKEKILFLDENLFSSGMSKNANALECYHSQKRLFYKNYDLVVTNRKLAFQYHYLLMKLAASSTLWVQMVVHFLLSVAKRPLYAVYFYAGLVGNFISYLFKTRVLHYVQRVRTSLFCGKIRRMHNENAWQKLTLWPTTRAVLRQEVRLEAKNEPYQFAYGRKAQNVLLVNNSSAIREGQFAYCHNLTRIVIPAYVRTIEDHAFQGCINLSVIEFEEGSILTKIGAFAFAECSALTEIQLPGTVTSIDEYAFAGCQNLESIRFRYYNKGEYKLSTEFPMAISRIREGTFAGCSSLQRVELLGNNRIFIIGADAFLRCVNLQSFIVNDTVQSIGAYAFAHCTSLKEFAMPHIDAVDVIGKGAFMQCHSLPYFQIPRALAIIPMYCFFGCKSFKTMKIPENITLVDTHAFEKCENLAEVTIAKNSTRIMRSSFTSPTKLRFAQDEKEEE